MTAPPTQAVVFLGGDALTGSPPTAPRVPVGAVVVAADAGLHRAMAFGVSVHHVVGDLDSVDEVALRSAEVGGAVVHRHDRDKDATDAELAVDLALLLVGGHEPTEGPADRPELVVIGSTDGRLDLLLTDLLLLAGPITRFVDVTAHLGPATVRVVRPGRPRTVTGHPGDQVSLLPIHGSASGVATEGLRWRLVDAHLAAGTTRGTSNELIDVTASVAVEDGVVAVVLPGTRAGAVPPRAGPYDPTPRPLRSVGPGCSTQQVGGHTGPMDVEADLVAPCPPAELYRWVEDLGAYPRWLEIVTQARPLEAGAGDRPAWAVDLRGRLGPLARSKRLRMERTVHDGATVRFERTELDGRDHSPWVLGATVAPDEAGSRLEMRLHYGGGLFGPVLERVLRDEIARSRLRLLTLVEAGTAPT